MRTNAASWTNELNKFLNQHKKETTLENTFIPKKKENLIETGKATKTVYPNGQTLLKLK